MHVAVQVRALTIVQTLHLIIRFYVPQQFIMTFMTSQLNDSVYA